MKSITSISNRSISIGVALALSCLGALAGDLSKEAKVTKAHAQETALKHVPGGTVKSSELERENGKLVYSFDISVKKGIKEVQIDAISGKVVSVKSETAQEEAKEQATEIKKAK